MLFTNCRSLDWIWLNIRISKVTYTQNNFCIVIVKPKYSEHITDCVNLSYFSYCQARIPFSKRPFFSKLILWQDGWRKCFLSKTKCNSFTQLAWDEFPSSFVMYGNLILIVLSKWFLKNNIQYDKGNIYMKKDQVK